MIGLMFTVGVIWLLLGAGVEITAKSAIHEILACLLFSFGILFFAVAAAFAEWRRERKSASAQSSAVTPPRLPAGRT